MKIKSGGGIQSNKTVHSQGYKTEPVTHRGNVAGGAQTGLSHAFKPEPMTQGKGYEPQKVGATGVANARKGPDGAGPGGFGRTIYERGSQSQYGANAANAVNRSPDPPATAPGRDILSGYGPERRR